MGNKVCPYCGAHLDPGESCDCVAAKYSRLTPENRDKFDTAIAIPNSTVLATNSSVVSAFAGTYTKQRNKWGTSSKMAWL